MKYTKAELSRILKVSRAAITQAARRGTLVVEKDGLIDTDKNTEYLKTRAVDLKIKAEKEKLKTVKEKVKTPPPKDQDPGADIDFNNGPDYNKARAELTEIKAKIAQLEYEKAQGIYVPVKDTEKAAFDCARVTRDKILAVSDRLCNVLAAETDSQQVRELLDNELRKALEEIDIEEREEKEDNI